ncbi:hypothetical protein RI367_008063 [Sorochytrium milnesiophthora]
MTSTTARERWVVESFGSLANMRLQRDTVDGEKLPANHVRVGVRFIGLNFADVFTALGLYQAAPPPPMTPGLEYSGVVLESASPDYVVGEPVWGVTRFGALASLIDSDAKYIRKLPTGWSLQEAAAFPVQAITAYYGLHILGALEDRNSPSASTSCKANAVLVHSAAGGVGLWALELCRAWGYHVLGTVGAGQSDKLAVLQERYANEIRNHGWRFVERTSPGRFQQDVDAFLDGLQQRTAAASNQQQTPPRGFDVVLDSLLGDYFHIGYKAMVPQGRHVVLGAGSMAPQGSLSWYNIGGWLKLAAKFLTRPRVDPLQMMGENKAVMGFNLIWLWEDYPLLEKCTAVIQQLAKDMRRPIVSKVFDWKDAPAALEYFQRGVNIGKVVVEVPEQ